MLKTAPKLHFAPTVGQFCWLNPPHPDPSHQNLSLHNRKGQPLVSAFDMMDWSTRMNTKTSTRSWKSANLLLHGSPSVPTMIVGPFMFLKEQSRRNSALAVASNGPAFTFV